VKEINDLKFPDDVRYTTDHEWARLEGNKIRVGITDYAQDQLGDIVFVETPKVGASFEHGQEFGTLESVKAVAELFIPVSGKIIVVNSNLEDSPGLVNTAPYSEGWIAEVMPDNPSEMDGLMTAEAYLEMLKGMSE
jgi:glycine cleavage system H protein